MTANLHSKLADIRAELAGHIVKTGEHTQGGPRYKFVEALEVGRQFVELASARGLTMLPTEQKILDIRDSKTGKQHVVTILIDWAITDSETGEVIHVQSIGQGADNSDKAAPKAQTNAMKYGVLMVLQAAGDDPEKDEPEAPQKRRARRTAVARNARVDTDEPDEGDEEDDSRDPREEGVTPSRRRPRRSEPEQKPGVELASSALKAKVRARQHEVELDDQQFRAFGMHFTGKASSKEWTTAEAEKVLAKLDNEGAVEMFKEVKGIYQEA